MTFTVVFHIVIIVKSVKVGETWFYLIKAAELQKAMLVLVCLSEITGRFTAPEKIVENCLVFLDKQKKVADPAKDKGRLGL